MKDPIVGIARQIVLGRSGPGKLDGLKCGMHGRQ